MIEQPDNEKPNEQEYWDRAASMNDPVCHCGMTLSQHTVTTVNHDFRDLDEGYSKPSFPIHQTPEGWWVIDGDECISKWVADSKRLDHDQWLLPRILPLVPRDGTVVEAGAYIGNHTIAFLNWGCKVIAYEPNPVAAECLRRNCPKATIVEAALGDYEGRADMEIYQPNPGASRLCNWTEQGGVLVRELDNHEPCALDLFMIDVEGRELDVLDGAEMTIGYYKPVMVIEINSGALARNSHRPTDVFGWLKAHGYQWHPIQELHVADPPQYDIIARPIPKCRHCGK